MCRRCLRKVLSGPGEGSSRCIATFCAQAERGVEARRYSTLSSQPFSYKCIISNCDVPGKPWNASLMSAPVRLPNFILLFQEQNYITREAQKVFRENAGETSAERIKEMVSCSSHMYVRNSPLQLSMLQPGQALSTLKSRPCSLQSAAQHASRLPCRMHGTPGLPVGDRRGNKAGVCCALQHPVPAPALHAPISRYNYSTLLCLRLAPIPPTPPRACDHLQCMQVTEGETRLEYAVHYGIPYPRLHHAPQFPKRYVLDTPQMPDEPQHATG